MFILGLYKLALKLVLLNPHLGFIDAENNTAYSGIYFRDYGTYLPQVFLRRIFVGPLGYAFIYLAGWPVIGIWLITMV